MSSILDSRTDIAKLDTQNMLGSIESLGKQVAHAWSDVQKVTYIPTNEIQNIVVAGMGGSALGADVIKHLFKEVLAVPFDFVNSYTLPEYVNEHSLVILSSYSGTTEEVLSCAAQAQEKNAQIMIIAAAGDLETLAKQHTYPFYKVIPTHNPSNQPRMAIGYAVFGLIGLLSAAGMLVLSKEDIDGVVATIDQVVSENTVEVPQESAPAKALAFSMIDRNPMLVSADFLAGALHVASNQHNENAKALVDYKLVPEINHHLMEGLRFPKSNTSSHFFVFVNSRLFAPKLQARMAITQKIVASQDIEAMELTLQAPTKLQQVFELITLFAFSSFYLSMLEGIDPSPIPYVDQFKEELQKYPV